MIPVPEERPSTEFFGSATATDTARQPAVNFRNVVKHHGTAATLAGVDLTIPSGSSFGLVGLNGAGKTSLIKCLLDFTATDSGAIEIFGEPHTRPRSRRRLAFLPERFTPPYFLTGLQFIRYVLGLHGTPHEPATVLDITGRLGLDESALRKPVRHLSKGMTQKLGLAACFLTGKDLYVLDEPMSGLDAKARNDVQSLLRQLKTQGRTVLFTTHALADVDRLCDHMAVLHDGKVLFQGKPDALRRQYDPDLEQAFLHCVAGESRPKLIGVPNTPNGDANPR